jgi:methylated-DNA-protein-cysteine methyltransferase-like protein
MPRAFLYARVYDLVRQVPPGRVTTYGAIAWALGMPRGARQVGWALAALSNQDEHDVPAHRVVNRVGFLSGGWAFGAPEVQRLRLEDEGVRFAADGRVPLDRYLWEPERVF